MCTQFSSYAAICRQAGKTYQSCSSDWRFGCRDDGRCCSTLGSLLDFQPLQECLSALSRSHARGHGASAGHGRGKQRATARGHGGGRGLHGGVDTPVGGDNVLVPGLLVLVPHGSQQSSSAATWKQKENMMEQIFICCMMLILGLPTPRPPPGGAPPEAPSIVLFTFLLNFIRHSTSTLA